MAANTDIRILREQTWKALETFELMPTIHGA